jgi:hypothetical protein
LATGPAPAYRPAPVASALPSAPSAPLGSVPPEDQYAYLNQAYAFSQSLADAPPDYTYDYQGEEPWVWQSPDGYYRVAERLPMGVRYFYYAPGASTPYLVQDPQYAYGYSGGRLTVVYGPDGQVLPYDVEARQSRAAGLYLAWAAGLYAAARHEQHVAVSAARWDGERQAVYADQARWTDAQHRNTGWASYSQAHPDDQAHWADQRYVRAAEAVRFAQAVHDPTALAHAQHAATDARAIAQSHGERPPGPAPESAPGRHEGGDAPIAAAASTGAQHEQPFPFHQEGRAPIPAGEPVQARDQARDRTVTDAEPPRQPERPPVASSRAEVRPLRDAGHQVRAEPRVAPVHQPQAPTSAAPPQRPAVERNPVESRPHPAEQAAPPARPPTPPPVLEARQPPQPQVRPPAPPHPAPHPEPPLAKPKPGDPHP